MYDKIHEMRFWTPQIWLNVSGSYGVSVSALSLMLPIRLVSAHFFCNDVYHMVPDKVILVSSPQFPSAPKKIHPEVNEVNIKTATWFSDF